MNEFENLKTGYIDTIHYGMACQTGYNETKHGNEILHKFCTVLVDSSRYSDSEKREMKHELDQIKEMISQEIEVFFSNRENYKMEKQLLEFSYSGPYKIQSTGFSYSKTISLTKEVSITNTINLDDPNSIYSPDSFWRETSDCYSLEDGT